MATGDLRYQIIPIFSPKQSLGTIPVPTFSCGANWPAVTDKFIDTFEKPLKKRVEKVILNVANLKGSTGFFLFAGAKIVLNRMFANKILAAIKDSLYKWDLIKGYKPSDGTAGK